MMRTRHALLRATAVAVAIALCPATIACGGSDDDDNGGGGAEEERAQADGLARPPIPLAETTAGSDEQQIRKTVLYANRSVRNGEVEAYCSKLTPAAQRQVVSLGASKGGQGCVGAMTGIYETTRQYAAENGLKNRPSKVLSVAVRGNEAVARVKDGGRPPVLVGFKRAGNEWKFDDILGSSTSKGR